ncbi:MAG TPA: cytosine deaminase [Roseiarcus sp.]|nr:cytosine deaminase [Roseiarcus sp.]
MPKLSLDLPQTPRYTLARARVPLSLLATPVDKARRDEEGCALIDIAIDRGRVAALTATSERPDATGAIDLGGRIVLPALVEPHAHLDKGQVYPRVRPDGSLYGGHAATVKDRARWTKRDIGLRMDFGIRCAYAHGAAAIRTHIDSVRWELAERGFGVLAEMRDKWRDRVVLQGVTIMPIEVYLSPLGEKVADLAAKGSDVLGGVTDAWETGAPHERLDEALDVMFALARERGLDVDLHVDQTEKVSSFTIPRIARAKMRAKFEGKVVCDHCVNLTLQTDEAIESTLALARDAGLAFISMPTPMMYLMDRRPGRTPKWRGVTAAKEIIAAGLPFAIGGDNCRDAWFPFGDHDMLDTFRQAVRVFQTDEDLSDFLRTATIAPADIMRLPELGRIGVGLPAKLILMSARNLNTMMCRDQADRIVLDRGVQVTEPLPSHEDLAEALQRPA